MLKILTTKQIREADAYTIMHEPIASIDLMERAAAACFSWLSSKFAVDVQFVICCGKGNNGGDGLSIARMLVQKGYKTKVFIFGKIEELSPDNKLNYERLYKLNDQIVTSCLTSKELPPIIENTVIVDALFGTGLTKAVKHPLDEVIKWMNESTASIVAIDIPSGMFADLNQIGFKNKIVNADYTLTFQFPKLSFLLPENGNSVGELVILDIGLHLEFIDKVATNYYFIEKSDIEKLLIERNPFSHKGNFGHALIVAGSEGKMGAAVLCAHACLRSGAGLVSAIVPAQGRKIMQISLPEAMLENGDGHVSASTDLSGYTAIGIGPGLGMSDEMKRGLKILIQNYRGPIVFDADAINMISQNKTWLGFLQRETIFTPHLKEFERLTEKAENDFHRLELAKLFATKNSTHLVLKGKYTCIVFPDGNCYFNPTGNSGMAKGGSGDVLTGIIASFLAQGYAAKEACLLGVYIHGMAGDFAASHFSKTAMIAGDIVTCLPEVFKTFSWKNSK